MIIIAVEQLSSYRGTNLINWCECDIVIQELSVLHQHERVSSV